MKFSILFVVIVSMSACDGSYDAGSAHIICRTNTGQIYLDDISKHSVFEHSGGNETYLSAKDGLVHSVPIAQCSHVVLNN